ncbi:SIMPL domain-containing protein [Methylobacter sp. BBA5.1]|uniref:SIMPL domain-containing protein n=1 Tax=Methylobacter sp. BBA5.1 TaxID=1495064 RepID=UPI00056BC5F1|nr:SIMPL domain-containing protein [Methylobacter sp. BBA5.1]
MNQTNRTNALILGLSFFLGLTALGYLLGQAAIDFKEYERSVTVKGLSERELPADVVIWPIVFTESGNDLSALYNSIEAAKKSIEEFLVSKGITAAEISHSLPSITDKSAQQYGNGQKAEFRYAAIQTVTVYSSNVSTVRQAMNELSELGKRGIAFTGEGYQNQTEYLFTDLNKIKPEMIQETTTKAREVALKFAEDSNSRLGKIKKASQGQFSIEPRDKNNPHIKKIRVVSTVEYYLSD